MGPLDIDIDTVATALIEASVEATPSWVVRTVTEVAGAQGLDVQRGATLAAEAGDRAARFVEQRLTDLLRIDIDGQRSTPLTVFRDAVRFPVEVLHTLGAGEVHRADVERWASPNDPFGITPASFADIGPDVHEAGIMWGAAKAAVHLRRRRDEGLR